MDSLPYKVGGCLVASANGGASKQAGKRCQVFGRPAVPVFLEEIYVPRQPDPPSCSRSIHLVPSASSFRSTNARYARELRTHRLAMKCFIDLQLGSESRHLPALPRVRCVSRTAANWPPCIPGEEVVRSERLIYQPK